ncbi:MAG: STAS domain-containing protein [Rhodanobacteraceae bacterium]
MLYEEGPGFLRVKVQKGELDDPSQLVQQLEDIVRFGSIRELYVDLSDYEGLTSLQIGALVTIHMTAYENLCRTIFENLTSRAIEVLCLAGVDKLITIHHGANVRKKSFGQ